MEFTVLRLDPSDRDALRTKLFLLLQTEQYDTALALIAEINDQCPFERAYALYRLQREEDAGQVLKEIKNDGKEPEQRGAMHLEAQLVSIWSRRFNQYQNGNNSGRVIAKDRTGRPWISIMNFLKQPILYVARFASSWQLIHVYVLSLVFGRTCRHPHQFISLPITPGFHHNYIYASYVSTPQLYRLNVRICATTRSLSASYNFRFCGRTHEKAGGCGNQKEIAGKTCTEGSHTRRVAPTGSRKMVEKVRTN
jgi:hypothetical protein